MPASFEQTQCHGAVDTGTMSSFSNLSAPKLICHHMFQWTLLIDIHRRAKRNIHIVHIYIYMYISGSRFQRPSEEIWRGRVQKNFEEMSKVEQCSDEMNIVEKNEMRWEELKWDEMKCGVWSVSAKYDMWRGKSAVWSVKCGVSSVTFGTAPLSHQTDTHNCSHASSTDEKSLIV